MLPANTRYNDFVSSFSDDCIIMDFRPGEHRRADGPAQDTESSVPRCLIDAVGSLPPELVDLAELIHCRDRLQANIECMAAELDTLDPSAPKYAGIVYLPVNVPRLIRKQE